jgi:hypothetical protein
MGKDNGSQRHEDERCSQTGGCIVQPVGGLTHGNQQLVTCILMGQGIHTVPEMCVCCQSGSFIHHRHWNHVGLTDNNHAETKSE